MNSGKPGEPPATPTTLTLQPAPAPGREGWVVPHVPTTLQRMAAVLACIVERLITITLRYKWRDAPGLMDPPSARPVIFCIWHNRLALSMVVHRKFPRKLAALISASKDGALLSAVLRRFGVLAVRGSSSRRGPQALLELTRQAERGNDLAITPDGPRGPRYVVQEGVISLAQVTGLSIVPVTWNTTWKICVKSWDGFQIPLPFARCEMVLSQPIRVPRGASEGEREELRTELERSLRGSSRD
jgi:lysophospholipid acyltransferase (LPLAT)-like uncharacterized protein